jgi:hypothetical protein
MANTRQKADESAEVATSANGNVTGPNAFQKLLAKMDSLATLDTSAGGENYRGDDIALILEAETEEEMWEADEVASINAKLLSGCALEILEFTVKYGNMSDIATPFVGRDGRKMYLSVTSFRLDKSGEKPLIRLPEPHQTFTWNTSARFIVAKLFWLLEKGYFDNAGIVQARIVGTNLGDGRAVEKLKPLSYQVVQGQANEPPF